MGERLVGMKVSVTLAMGALPTLCVNQFMFLRVKLYQVQKSRSQGGANKKLTRSSLFMLVGIYPTRIQTAKAC